MYVLQKFFVTLLLLLTAAYPFESSCVLEDITSNNEICTAYLQCSSDLHDLNSVVKEWGCIKIVGGQIYDYYRNRYSNQITYKSNYNLYINATDIYEEGGLNVLTEIKDHVKSVTLNDRKQVLIPKSFYNLPYVTEININYNILEKFPINNFYRNQNLKKLNVSHNLISQLETISDTGYLGNKDLMSLTSLDLSYNLIEELPSNMFVHVSQLQHLHLSHNKIQSFDVYTFEGVTQLQSLDLSHNSIVEIGHAFVRFVNLKTLYLNNNFIASVTGTNFVSMLKLEILNLTRNLIENVEDTTFQSLTSLKNIDLSYNRIKTITTDLFRNNSNINSLSLSNNKIQIIETGSFEGKNITNFLINNNDLSGSVKQSTFSGIKVEILDLSHAQIETLEDEAFSSMSSKIMSLNLTSNKINNISITAFKSLKMLKDLDISKNYLTLLNFETEDLYNLSALYLYNNKIKKIHKSFFKHLVGLEVLDFSNNLIDEVEENSFDKLNYLKKLVLENNVLVNNVDANIFKGLISLSEIELMNSRIQSYNNYSFSSMSSLVTVNSSNGLLSNIQYNTFVNTSAMEILDLSFNLLEDFAINVKNMKSLKNLFLNNNKIRKISNETFYGFTSLLNLDISHNNLLTIESKAFISLKNMLYLKLSSNPEMEISSTIFDDIPILSKVLLANTVKPFNFENAINSSIEHLHLPDCGVVDIDKVYVYKIKNVVTLNLSNNKIGFIDKLSFFNMSSLVTLELSFNLIRYLQPGSFLGTNMINTLNLHSNYIESIQFGVLDGLKYLNLLNLSSNLLHNFELKLLHKTPRLTTLALDDNRITNMRLYNLDKINIKILSIGGNEIRCRDILDTNNSIKLNYNITAQRLNYHSENVNGITCKTDVKGFLQSSLSSYNFTESLDNFTHAIKELQQSIEGFANKSTNTENVIKNNFVNVATAVERLASHSNNTQREFDHYLKTLADINNETQFSLKHMDNKSVMNNLTPIISNISILEKANDEARDELRNILQKWQDSLNKAPAKDRSVEDIKILLYFMSVCMAIVVIIVVCSCLYVLRRNHSIFRSNAVYKSSHPSTNTMEME